MAYQRPKIKKWDIIGTFILFTVLAILYPITKKWQENKVDNYIKNGYSTLGFVIDKKIGDYGNLRKGRGTSIQVLYFYVVNNDTIETYDNIDIEEYKIINIGCFYDVKYFKNDNGYSSMMFPEKKYPRPDSVIYYKGIYY